MHFATWAIIRRVSIPRQYFNLIAGLSLRWLLALGEGGFERASRAAAFRALGVGGAPDNDSDLSHIATLAWGRRVWRVGPESSLP